MYRLRPRLLVSEYGELSALNVEYDITLKPWMKHKSSVLRIVALSGTESTVDCRGLVVGWMCGIVAPKHESLGSLKNNAESPKPHKHFSPRVNSF